MVNARFPQVEQGQIERFGQTSSSDQREVQTLAGARFPNTFATWNNEVSEIQLEQRAGSIYEVGLGYFHTACTDKIARKKKELGGTPGSRM